MGKDVERTSENTKGVKMSIKGVPSIPNTKDYKRTLKRFKGYYCPDKINIKR